MRKSTNEIAKLTRETDLTSGNCAAKSGKYLKISTSVKGKLVSSAIPKKKSA